jgi:hypothetical protein
MDDTAKIIASIQRDTHKWKYRGEPMVIAVDFDGTCVENLWPEKPVSMPDAVDSIKRLLHMGNTIVIWTCRNETQPLKFGEHSGIQAVYQWVRDNFAVWNGDTFEYPSGLLINESAPSSLARIGETRKVFAHVYIDDRNLGGFPGWKETLKLLGID